MTKRALILGVGGQDGSFLADLLLEKGYEVHGLYRRSSHDNLKRIAHCRDRITLHQGDITDRGSVFAALRDSCPDEVYNEADQDHIGWSYRIPELSWDVTFKAVATLLEEARGFNPGSIRVFQPVSSTVFGNAPPPQDEHTPLNPMSPYAVTKAAAWHVCRYYRRVHRMYVSVGIMYNHDSPRRCNQGYLLHELVEKARDVASGKVHTLTVGDPDAVVDVGYAKEYMEAAWLSLQQPESGDYVVCSGQSSTVHSAAVEALVQVGVPRPRAEETVVADGQLKRAGPRHDLVGDGGETERRLGWKARTGIPELLSMIREGER